MPFQPGQPRPAGAGRKKGAIAKVTHSGRTRLSAEVSLKLQELGCDPIEGMARLATDEKQEVGIRARMYAELAQYVWPKRRAIEHSGPGGEPIQFDITAKQALEDRITGIAANLRTANGITVDSRQSG